MESSPLNHVSADPDGVVDGLDPNTRVCGEAAMVPTEHVVDGVAPTSLFTRAKRRWSRAISRSSSLTRGSSAFALRPRFLDVIPTLAISSRWRRQLDNCDEYKPSRRRRAATSPSPLPKASASRTIRSLYSAVERRRFACATTSGSSTPAAARPAGSLVALRAPADPAAR